MKLIIAGSRTFSDYQRLCQLGKPVVVIRTDTTA
jgi:hypothetical protein